MMDGVWIKAKAYLKDGKTIVSETFQPPPKPDDALPMEIEFSALGLANKHVQDLREFWESNRAIWVGDTWFNRDDVAALKLWIDWRSEVLE